MTNSELLQSKIKDSGITISSIARKLEISREGFYKKMNNETEFRASEIVKMKDILHLSNSERDLIFFAKGLNKIQLKK